MPCSGDNKDDDATGLASRINTNGDVTSLTPHVKADDDATGLTSREKEAIRQSWKLVNADPETNGVELLVRLFKERPSTQLYFNKFSNVTEEQMRENCMVRNHAINVMLSITNLVNNLDNEQILLESLHKLSTIHHELNVSSEDIRFILSLLRQLMKDSLGVEYDVFTDESWAKCNDVIYSVIDVEMRKLKS